MDKGSLCFKPWSSLQKSPSKCHWAARPLGVQDLLVTDRGHRNPQLPTSHLHPHLPLLHSSVTRPAERSRRFVQPRKPFGISDAKPFSRERARNHVIFLWEVRLLESLQSGETNSCYGAKHPQERVIRGTVLMSILCRALLSAVYFPLHRIHIGMLGLNSHGG